MMTIYSIIKLLPVAFALFELCHAQKIPQEYRTKCTVAANEWCFTDASKSCPPGYHQNHQYTDCSHRRACCPCPQLTFQPQWNICYSCIECKNCSKTNQEVSIHCNITHDTECGDTLTSNIPEETDNDSNRETHVPPVWDCSSSEEVVVPGHDRTQEETTGDDEMSGEGIYHFAKNPPEAHNCALCHPCWIPLMVVIVLLVAAVFAVIILGRCLYMSKTSVRYEGIPKNSEKIGAQSIEIGKEWDVSTSTQGGKQTAIQKKEKENQLLKKQQKDLKMKDKEIVQLKKQLEFRKGLQTISPQDVPKYSLPTTTNRQDNTQAVDSMECAFQNLTNNWPAVGRSLGLSEGTPNHIQQENVNSVQRMLQLWKQQNGDKAMCPVLIEDLVMEVRPDFAEGLQSHKGAGGLKCLGASSSISKEGGTIEIPNTGVQLLILPKSFFEEDEVHLITLKILPQQIFDEPARCFEDHSTVMVEILPNNLKLQRPAKLTLPHCLILKEPKRCDVQIFHSHHEHDQLPNWENITKSVKHELSAHFCKIWIENFSWIKYEIGDKEVEGKKVFLYTLGKKYTKGAELVTAEVGYFPALPGNDRHIEADFITSVKRMCNESKLKKMFQGDLQLFIFWKKPRKPLVISISEINPIGGWKASPQSSESKEILYDLVELSVEQGCPFTFQRQKSEAPFPVIHFKISQGEYFSEVYVDMEEGMGKEGLEATSSDQALQTISPQAVPNPTTNRQNSTQAADPMQRAFLFLSKHLTNNWQAVGRRLWLNGGTLHHIQQENINSIQNAVYTMLETWRQQRGYTATYSVLIEALVVEGRTDLAERLQNREDLK